GLAAAAAGGTGAAGQGGGVLRQEPAPDGVPGVPGGGLAPRQRSGGERVQDGGGAAAEAGGDALGGGRHARGLPDAGAVPQRAGAVGGVLGAPLHRPDPLFYQLKSRLPKVGEVLLGPAPRRADRVEARPPNPPP